MQSLAHPFKAEIGRIIAGVALVDSVSDERNRTLRARRVVTEHLSENGYFVTPLLVCSKSSPPAVSIAVPMRVIIRRPLYKVIHVGSLKHLREIQRDPIKYNPRLSVGTDVFVASPRNSRCARHKLRDHENDYRNHKHRHE